MQDAQCCIAGGGPAGLTLGYLLARQGVEVVVLEAHEDFLRDFRGDTIHPSTLELFAELGLLDGLLALPHQRVSSASITFGEESYEIADFGRLPTRCKFIAMMPQWDFLSFLADKARALPNFRLVMSTEADDLIEADGRILGLRARAPSGPIEIRAPLTVAADGRGSALRRRARLGMETAGAPIDVFWMRLPRRQDGPSGLSARASADGFLVLIDRGDYWQCALPIAKGGAEAIRGEGIEAFRARIGRIAPMLAEAATALWGWEEVRLLTVQVDMLKTWWREGFLAIGDAAHAMSPVGGVGVNLAIQDGAAAARILGPSLKAGGVAEWRLSAMQKRRQWPARMTQRAQIAAQDRVVVPALSATAPLRAPRMVKLLNRSRFLRGLTGRAIGLGFRPEHWRAPD